LDACGVRYARDTIRTAVSNFARNNTGASSRDPALSNKPLRYCDLQSAITGGDRDYGTQLATPSKHQFDDRALYFLMASSVKDRLAALMADMSPEDFGYNNIHSDKIGSDRATRRKEIEALSAKLDDLKARRSDLSEKLATLGVSAAELRQLDAKLPYSSSRPTRCPTTCSTARSSSSAPKRARLVATASGSSPTPPTAPPDQRSALLAHRVEIGGS
jgi:hypothetical protein